VSSSSQMPSAALLAPLLWLARSAAVHAALVAATPGTSATPDAVANFWPGKRVLLAGASSGLGEALAHELSSRGASLVLAARRADRLQSIADACVRVADEGATQPAILPMDVTDNDDVLGAHAASAAELLGGPVDVLCYAAGVGQRTVASATTADGHKQLMATNFEGAVGLTRAVLPPMLARGTGHLVVISSVQGFFGQPGRSSYAASKAAMNGYFDALRAEVAASGVRVTVVAPGYIATDHSASAVGGDGAADENAKKGMPPEELAAQIADAVEKQQPQLLASQLDGRLAILLRAIWPSAFFKLMEGKAKKL